MAGVDGYTAYAYNTRTGRIVGPSELPLVEAPTWNRQINNNGMWSTALQLGVTGGWTRAQVRAIAEPWRFSVGIFWGDYCCQAGPVIGYPVDDGAGRVTLTGGGFWSLLNRRMLVNSAWNPAAVPVTDAAADVTLVGSLRDIGIGIVATATTSAFRPAMALPVDLPALSGSTAHTRTYMGYEMAMGGQRLQELTQADGGPDVDFAPYRTPGTNIIRHRMAVGDPFIVQTGADVAFDYGTSLQALGVDGDGSAMATTAWVKGAGNERGQLYAAASSTVLTDAGWPQLDYVDSAHTSATEQSTLDSWAAADLALYGRSVEAWKGIVRADDTSPLGTYDPGFFATYNAQGHPWLPDGQYRTRILGIGNGLEANTVAHVLDGRGGF